MSIIGLGMQAAGAVGQAFGIGNKRQLKQQEKLNQQQVKSQKELAEHQKQIQMDIWNKTNYKAQVQHLKQAGLNPALLYGMGGSGGATTGAGMATGVTGGHAEGGSAAMQALSGMGMQIAQMDLIKAQTEKTKAEAENIGGVDREKKQVEIQSLTQGIANAKQAELLQKAQTRLTEMQGQITGATMNDVIERMTYEVDKAASEMQIAWNEAFVSRGTRDEKVKIAQQEAIYGGLKNILTKAQTEKEYSGIQVNEAQIKQIAENIAMGWKGLNQGDEKIAMEQFRNEIANKYPSIGQSMGRQFEDWIGAIWNMIGKQRPTYNR